MEDLLVKKQIDNDRDELDDLRLENQELKRRIMEDTAQGFCEKHNLAVAMVKYKDGSHDIRISKRATQKEILDTLIIVIGDKFDDGFDLKSLL